MAKNDKKPNPQPAAEKKPEVNSAPEKIVATPAAKAPEKPETPPHKPLHPAEPPHKKRHGFRNFLLFIILLAAGAVGYLTVQLRQTEKLNAEALDKLQAAYDEKISAVTNRVNALDREVTGLKNRPIVEHAAGISENMLNQKLAALREELLGNTATENPQAGDETAEKTDATAAAPQILAAAANRDDKFTKELLLASGAIIIRDLAEQGVNFAYEAEVLQILAQGNELAENNVRVIRNYANAGINGKQNLIRGFNKLFTELNSADLKSAEPQQAAAENIKWYQKVLNWLKQQVTAKKRQPKPVFTPQKDEVWELVNEGRIKDALEALSLSEKYAKVNSEPLTQWRFQAERYLMFDSAVNAVIMNSLANIRLKEMEH